MHYVYVLCDAKGNTYIGCTSDLRRRVAEHNSGANPSTRGSSWRLVYYEAFLSSKDARARESKLKRRGQAKRHLMARIQHSLDAGCVELSAR